MSPQEESVAGTLDAAASASPTAAPQPRPMDYGEFKAMLMDPEVPDSEIAPYLKALPEGSGAFDPRIVPDPEKVDLTSEADFDVESAIRWGNAICRWRRKEKFLKRVARGDKRPVLCTEGDSWFQFPFLIDDVVDHLDDDFLVWSLDAAGDTADNMINRNPEYMSALVGLKQNKVSGFALSAAGNDVIGEDLTGEPVLSSLLKQHSPGKDAAWHIDKAALAAVLSRLERDYRRVVGNIRSDDDFKRLPIFFHGYDYVIPGGYPGDRRHPSYAKQDEWLGGPMTRKGIVDVGLQRAIIRVLIDSLYDMLDRVAGKSSQTRVFVVDVRQTLQDGEWADEIHGTSEGFRQVATKFKAKISKEI